MRVGARMLKKRYLGALFELWPCCFEIVLLSSAGNLYLITEMREERMMLKRIVCISMLALLGFGCGDDDDTQPTPDATTTVYDAPTLDAPDEVGDDGGAGDGDAGDGDAGDGDAGNGDAGDGDAGSDAG